MIGICPVSIEVKCALFVARYVFRMFVVYLPINSLEELTNFPVGILSMGLCQKADLPDIKAKDLPVIEKETN